MLEYGPLVSLGLLVIWLILLILLVRDTLTPAQYRVTSLPFIAMIAFFWLSTEITELIIPHVGTLRTRSEQAKKYLDEIKDIRTKVEDEAKTVNAALSSLKTDILDARAELAKLQAQMADRQITETQVSQIAGTLTQFAGQEFSVGAVQLREPRALAGRIRDTLKGAGWRDIHESDEFYTPFDGVHVSRHPRAEETIQKAADALVMALKEAGIFAIINITQRICQSAAE